MSNGLAVEAIVAQIRSRIAQENARKSGPSQTGLSADEGPSWHAGRCRQRMDEDTARFADLDSRLETAARNIGQQPFAPPTWRGRVGAWIVQVLRRLLWWYGLPIKESIAQIGFRNREQAIRHRYLREDLLALSESLQTVVSRIDPLQKSQDNAAETAVRGLREIREDWSRQYYGTAQQITALNDQIEQLKAALGVSESLHGNLALRVAYLEARQESEAKAREAQLDKALGNLGERIADAIGRAERLEQTADALNLQLQAETRAREVLASVLNGQADKLQQITRALEPLAGRVSGPAPTPEKLTAAPLMRGEFPPGKAPQGSSSEDLQLLTVREVTGRIEAVLSWIPDPALRREAEGAELHLSSHVLDSADGRVIIFDGPRAIPCRGPEARLAVLPLTVPLHPGRYRVQIEPVVESRFWAADRGFRPLVLEAERRPDGSLVFSSAATDRQYVLSRPGTPTFSVDTPLYGLDDSERCIEIPWVLSRYREEPRVLDVGHTNAEPRFLQARDALKIPFLVGLDLVAVPQSRISGVAGDALALPFRRGAFDLIFAISVIEHIGRDNSIYCAREQPARELGDLEAAAGLAALLRPGGRLLVTVPFGRLEDHGWFVQYDLRRVQTLVESSGCELTLAEYYAYGAHGWTGPADPAALSQVEYRTGFAAGAVACLELTRLNETGSKAPSRHYQDRISDADDAGSTALSRVLSPRTSRILKLSGAWSKMRGETDRMRPIMLFCETVNFCNADCVFCPYSAQTRPRGIMKSELFEAVLSQYSQIGGGRLTLTPMVGDVLVDRLWMERIRLLAGMAERITPSVTTNLYGLDRYSDQEVGEMLRVLARIHVSCYGVTADECETITRRHSFERFITQARRLLSLRQMSAAKCEIRIGFRLLKPRSTDELETFLRERLGSVLPYGATATYANWGNAMHGALPGEALWVPDRTNESACIMLPLAMQIYWDGRVSACSCCDYDSSSQLHLGDLTQQSLSEIFNSPASQEIWRAHENACLPPICRNCTFHVPLADLNSKHPIVQNQLDFIGG